MRPHIDFFEMAAAEERLLESLGKELGVEHLDDDALQLVHRWYDRAWRRAWQEWSELRCDGERAFFSLDPQMSGPCGDLKPARLVLPACDSTDPGRAARPPTLGTERSGADPEPRVPAVTPLVF